MRLGAPQSELPTDPAIAYFPMRRWGAIELKQLRTHPRPPNPPGTSCDTDGNNISSKDATPCREGRQDRPPATAESPDGPWESRLLKDNYFLAGRAVVSVAAPSNRSRAADGSGTTPPADGVTPSPVMRILSIAQ